MPLSVVVSLSRTDAAEILLSRIKPPPLAVKAPTPVIAAFKVEAEGVVQSQIEAIAIQCDGGPQDCLPRQKPASFRSAMSCWPQRQVSGVTLAAFSSW